MNNKINLNTVTSNAINERIARQEKRIFDYVNNEIIPALVATAKKGKRFIVVPYVIDYNRTVEVLLDSVDGIKSMKNTGNRSISIEW